MFQKYLPMIWHGLFLFFFYQWRHVASVHLSTGDVLPGLRHGAHLEAFRSSSSWTHDGGQSHRARLHFTYSVELLLKNSGSEEGRRAEKELNETSRWRQWGNHRSSCITYFLGDTESSSIVDSSSPSRPKWSLLFFCKNTTHKSD